MSYKRYGSEVCVKTVHNEVYHINNVVGYKITPVDTSRPFLFINMFKIIVYARELFQTDNLQESFKKIT